MKDDTVQDTLGCSRPSSNDAPKLEREHRIMTRQAQREQQAGYVGMFENRMGYGFVKVATKGSKDNPQHWLYALDAYAISNDALQTAKNYGASRVLVVEEDTGDVLEWPVDAFDTGVPDKFLYTENDPQTYANCTDARLWPDHADYVFSDYRARQKRR